MSKRSMGINRSELGFFLMEVVVLVIVFISFSTIVVGWYSNFVTNKMDTIKRGRAIFIASNILESIRMSGTIPKQTHYVEGFKVTVTAKRNNWYKKSASSNFAEVVVIVDYSERLKPVCLSTGFLLNRI